MTRLTQDCEDERSELTSCGAALSMMIDYAILEGAQLKLPLFVYLLRMARCELMSGIARSHYHAAFDARAAESGDKETDRAS